MMSNQEMSVKKIMIIGVPNTGKSLIFSNLTGKFTEVANSPLTTIQIKTAPLVIGEQRFIVFDTPGLHSLYIQSEEEIVVRTAIFSEMPDIIVQCMDANRLKQSLGLTNDLMTLGLPMVICLNAIDETARKGMWIDSTALSRLLGVPVVESIALQAKGTSELKTAILRARAGKCAISYGDIIENGLFQLVSKLPEEFAFRRTIAVLMLMNDSHIERDVAESLDDLIMDELHEEIITIKQHFRGNIHLAIENQTSRWINRIYDKVVKQQRLVPSQAAQKIAGLCRHPLWGLPILFCVVYMLYFLVANVANVISEWMSDVLWSPVESGINAILPSGFWHDLLIGDYGVLSLGIANALMTVLPILGVFFLLFNTLEEIGYIPNLSVLTKRMLAKFGLSGGAIMPLVLGFGCKTMATLTTKILRSDRERFIAIFLIAFAIPCAPQIGLSMSILGRMGVSAFVIAFSVRVFIGMTSGLLLNLILKQEEEKFVFIQELPEMKWPSPRLVLKKTYYRLYWFLRESLMVFIYAALALFFLQKLGILEAMKQVLRPVVEGFLGLPLAMVDAIILCFARSEAGAGFIINLVQKGQLDYIQCIVAVIITTTFAPCFANIVAMIKEVGGKRASAMLCAITLSAFSIAGAVNWGIRKFM
jgi:ferrous iron transport protein B